MRESGNKGSRSRDRARSRELDKGREKERDREREGGRRGGTGRVCGVWLAHGQADEGLTTVLRVECVRLFFFSQRFVCMCKILYPKYHKHEVKLGK